MHYSKYYTNLMASRRCRPLKKEPGFELHHIVPRCLGGQDDRGNLVKLTIREHFIAHLLLTKMYPDHQKLWYSLYKMNNFHRKSGACSSRTYEKLRSQFYAAQSIRMCERNPMAGKISPMRGRRHSSVSRELIADKTRQLFKDAVYRDKHRRGVSRAVTGQKHPFFGKHHSEDSLKKMCATKGAKPFDVFKDSEFVGTWWSQTQCCRDLNLASVGNLNSALKNHAATYKGYAFKYKS